MLVGSSISDLTEHASLVAKLTPCRVSCARSVASRKRPTRLADDSRTVPPEVEASYSAIIDGILAKSDLHKVSAKQIRKGLQAQVSYDISSQKVRHLCQFTVAPDCPST